MTEGPVVVAILSHRDPPQLHRLVRRVLEGRRTVALVHHDPRGEPHELVPDERVRLVRDPRPCPWGRIGFADAMVRCLREGVRQVPDLSWLLMISGQDYPVRSMTAVEDELAATDAHALLRHFPVPTDPGEDVVTWQATCRRRYLHRRRLPGLRHTVPLPRRHPFRDGLGLYVGDTWFNLARPAIDHVLAQSDRLPQVRRYLATCSSPDEALVPTLLLNDAHRLRIGSDRKRFIRWVEGSWHPQVLVAADAPAVLASGDFFARKVDSTVSGGLLDALDAAASMRTAG
jgi:hypothetical protein